MKVGLVTLAAGIFLGAVLFDVAPDALHNFGLIGALLLLTIGIITWVTLQLAAKRVTDHSFAAVASLAIWAHSLLEGILTALSFRVNPELGIIVSVGILVHLLPEFFAVVAILRHNGLSTKQAIGVDAITVGILASSFAFFKFAMPGVASAGFDVSAAIIGGAFLYVGGLMAYRLSRSLQSAAGLASGLTFMFAWSLVMQRVFHL